MAPSVFKTIINGMTFDGATKEPMAQAEATKEAQKAGVAHAKASPNPLKPRTYLGRKPSCTDDQISQVTSLTADGKGVSEIAKQLGLSRATGYRVQKCPEEAFTSVGAWN
jgi:DNA invertase Pin-like site-specific DNA recombinase